MIEAKRLLVISRAASSHHTDGLRHDDQLLDELRSVRVSGEVRSADVGNEQRNIGVVHALRAIVDRRFADDTLAARFTHVLQLRVN